MPPPGRPRDPNLDEAAIQAAVTLIVESGYHSLTMDRIATRAGVSKAALYRRWPNKLELVVGAVEHFAAAKLRLPDTGDARADVTEYLLAFVREGRAQVKIYEALGAALASEPELAERCRETLRGEFSTAFRTIVERAVERGQLPADTDVALLADVAPALIRHRQEATGERLDETFIDRIAAQFFSG